MRFTQTKVPKTYLHGPMLFSFTPKTDGFFDDHHAFLVPYDASPMFEWCVDQFGPNGVRWQVHRGFFLFTQQTDATAFRIRWG